MRDTVDHNVPEEELEVDLREIFNVLRKWRKFIIVGTILMAMSAGLLSFFVLPPIFEAQTLLMVTQATDKLQNLPAQQGDDGLENVVSNVSRMPVWTMSTYLGQLKSEALMKRIIKKCELDPQYYTPSALAEMIDAEVVKDSNLIQVKVQNADAKLATSIANTLSDEYLQLMTEKNQEQMSRSVSFLEKQKTTNDKQLQKAIEDLKNFQSQPGGKTVLEAEFTSMTKDLETLNSSFQTTQIEIQQLTAGVATLQKEVDATPKTVMVERWDAASSAPIRMQDNNPVYENLSQQLSEKKALLAEKESQMGALGYTLDSIRAELDNLQSQLVAKKTAEDKLQREVDRLRQTSDTLALKTTETQMAKSIDLGDTSVIVVSGASIPITPVKPNKKLNIAIGFVLGLLLFTLLAFLLEYLDNTFKTPEDVEKELGLPVLGLIPKYNGNPH